MSTFSDKLNRLRGAPKLYEVYLKLVFGNRSTEFKVAVEDYNKKKAVKRAITEAEEHIEIKCTKVTTQGKVQRVIKEENYTK